VQYYFFLPPEQSVLLSGETTFLWTTTDNGLENDVIRVQD